MGHPVHIAGIEKWLKTSLKRPGHYEVAFVGDPRDARLIARARKLVPELVGLIEALEMQCFDYSTACTAAEETVERMKARAGEAERKVNALMEALKKHAACETCTGKKDCDSHGKAIACTLGGFAPDAWQFDYDRFKEDGHE